MLTISTESDCLEQFDFFKLVGFARYNGRFLFKYFEPNKAHLLKRKKKLNV